MIGFEIASLSKLVPGGHQKCSDLWQGQGRGAHICCINHRTCDCSQLSVVTLGHISQNWSKLSLLITISTIITSHLSCWESRAIKRTISNWTDVQVILVYESSICLGYFWINTFILPNHAILSIADVLEKLKVSMESCFQKNEYAV